MITTVCGIILYNNPPIIPNTFPSVEGGDGETGEGDEKGGNASSPGIGPSDIAGKTPEEIDEIAKDLGLIPKGEDPKNGKWTYVDPVTGEQRILVHQSPKMVVSSFPC
ncbi:hypothetical protein [Kiloniella litopenaei]|uniref:hypothetical protein n=1 Tax=Kiloniella litopenaei TaxID=1549748 RepID=UPI003BA8C0D4